MSKIFTFDLGGNPLRAEFGRLAEQANGSVLITIGGTTVLATAVAAKKPRVGGNFLPLMVDYEEKLYAAGKIKGSRFIKREGRATDEAILTGRLIDRPIRPRFDQRIRNDIQVTITVLSFDRENDPDMLGILGASLALATSDIPWNGPIAGVRIARQDSQFVVNPSYAIREKSDLDIMVAGDEEHIIMLEGEAEQIDEETALAAIEFGWQHLKQLVTFQKKIIAELNPQKTPFDLKDADQNLINEIKNFLRDKLAKAIYVQEKTARQNYLGLLKEELINHLKQNQPALDENALKETDILFEKEIDQMVHENILEKNKRPDGRKLDELRELNCEINILPRTHGSALFKRGGTQALSVVTLGAPSDQQIIDDMEAETKKRFFHHYNFPAYSVGEIGPFRGPGRREIGHGALAEKALGKILPSQKEFPYTIRVVSEILSSNGSSSMASVCASSLAMMDAGIPIKTPAAGIALGLMIDKKGEYKILTDIQGPEDHYGDMDLKIAGTQKGICALQMDIKIDGVNLPILKDAFNQAKKARLEILKKITQTISEPRPDLSVFAPRITAFQIKPEKIREVIGPGGKIINEIIDKTGAQIDIEDSGLIFITAKSKTSGEEALKMIQDIVREVQMGDVFTGQIVRLLNFGAFVELWPGQDGLLHISELTDQRGKTIESLVKIGDMLTVKVKEIDSLGRVNLSLAKK